MKRLFATLALPTALALGMLSLGVAAGPAGAEQAHATMKAHTWHGKVGKLNETMGATESFNLIVGAKTYVVQYDAMTHWVMGSKKSLKVGALVTVTGTLTHSTIAAAKLSA
jgi:spermidine/putrescine-binding protein